MNYELRMMEDDNTIKSTDSLLTTNRYLPSFCPCRNHQLLTANY